MCEYYFRKTILYENSKNQTFNITQYGIFLRVFFGIGFKMFFS